MIKTIIIIRPCELVEILHLLIFFRHFVRIRHFKTTGRLGEESFSLKFRGAEKRGPISVGQTLKRTKICSQSILD